MPSWSSSQAVSRDPCSSGRVSSAMTWARAPRSRSARITPSAVPHPRQASAPVLQCVWTFSGPAPHSSMRRSAPALAEAVADLDGGVADGEGGGFDRLGSVGEHGGDGEYLAPQVDRSRAGVGDPLDLRV